MRSWSSARKRVELQRAWSEVSYPDRPPARRSGLRAGRVRCAARCRQSRSVAQPDFRSRPQPFVVTGGSRPKIAILREQGVNGQVEMAAAFDRAGFARCRCAHVRPAGRPRASGRLQGPRRLRRFLLRRRARRRAGLGQVGAVQPAAADEFAAFFAAAGHLRAGRLQRLPDDEHTWRPSFPAPVPGRPSSATAASSSRHAS